MHPEQKRRKIKQEGKDAGSTVGSGRDELLFTGMKQYRPTGKKWVLVMENDKILQKVTRRILEKAGYGVYMTDSGDDVIECYGIAKHCGYHFAAVILDLNTPHGKGGVETIGKLRAIDPEVRAIISTGKVSDSEITNYRKHGFRSVLAKPFKPKELKQALLEAL